jgi:hypothetical protein
MVCVEAFVQDERFDEPPGFPSLSSSMIMAAFLHSFYAQDHFQAKPAIGRIRGINCGN